MSYIKPLQLRFFGDPMPWEDVKTILLAQHWEWQVNGNTKDKPPEEQVGALVCKDFDASPANIKPLLFYRHARMSINSGIPPYGDLTMIYLDREDNSLKLLGQRKNIEQLLGVKDIANFTPQPFRISRLMEQQISVPVPSRTKPGPETFPRNTWYLEQFPVAGRPPSVLAFCESRPEATFLQKALESQGITTSHKFKAISIPDRETNPNINYTVSVPQEFKAKLEKLLEESGQPGIIAEYNALPKKEYRQLRPGSGASR